MKLRWPLPPPRDFNEGQRALYGCLAASAGMFCGACSIGMIALLMWGGWSKSEEHTIVLIFGWSLGGFIAAMSAVIIGLMVGGPVGRFKATVGRDGGSLEAEAPGEQQVVTATTTSTTVAAPAPSGGVKLP